MQTLTVDATYDIIGHFLFEQKIYFVVLGVVQIFLGHHMILSAYTGLEAPFVCIPKNQSLYPKRLHDACPDNNPDNCYFEYNSTFKSMQEEWDLVCKEKYKIAFVQSVFMFGVMMGALLLGRVADQIGRLKTLMISLIGMMIFEGCSAFVPSYDILIVLRFGGGVFCAIVILSSFVLSQELVGSSYRSFIGIIGGCFFPIGLVLLSILAANVGDWRTLSFFCSIVGITCLFVPCFLPESPRWLLIHGKKAEARQVLEHIAKQNGTFEKLPTHWQLSTPPENNSKGGLKQIIHHSFLFRLTLTQITAWFVTSCVYYALTMAASGMKTGNVYISTSLNALVEFPANFVSYFVIDRLGRKISITGFLILGGCSCLLIPLIGSYYPASVFALSLFGKMSVSAVFSSIYIHSSELYPTIIRNTGMGIVSVAARIGGMVAPFVLMLSDVRDYLHFLVLGLLMTAAGFLSWQLPETLNKPMPETVEDLMVYSKIHVELPIGKGYSRLRSEDDIEKIFLDEEEI